MIFMRMEDGQWINARFIETIYVVELQENEAEVLCLVDGRALTARSFESKRFAQEWLDNYMQWSVNGG